MANKAVVVGHEYETQSGRRARVICTDRASARPVVALVQLKGGDSQDEELHSYTSSGQSHITSDLNLVEVKRRTYYRSICVGGIGHNNHPSKAEVVAMHNSIGCIRVDLRNEEVVDITVHMWNAGTRRI